MARTEERLAALARDIGPRPACEEGEREAGEWIRDLFEAKDLSVEQQRIRSVCTYSFTYLVYFIGAILVALASRFAPEWAALGGVLLAVAFYFELDTRRIVSRVIPKGNSRNIIGRLHAPGSGSATVVVICAHYDSAKAALPFNPRLVGQFRATFIVTAGSVWLITLLAIARAALGWLGSDMAQAATYVWYAMLVPAAYLLFPTAMYVHRELAMPFVDGANDNASGVVAMLEVMERIASNRQRPVPRMDFEEGVGPEGSSGARTPEEGGYPQGAPGVSGPTDAAPADNAPVTPLLAGFDRPASGDSASSPSVSGEGGPGEDWGDVALTDWLGVDDEFDVRREGQRIGAYARIEDEDVIDHPHEREAFERLAGELPEEEVPVREAPDLAFTGREHVERQARVTAPGLADKEVWFVATGGEEAGTMGIIEFVKRYGTRLRDAYFINIDNVGSGRLTYVSDEGLVRTYEADRRLMGAAQSAGDSKGLDVQSLPYHLLTTDATALLARGHRAMSVMAFDERGHLPNWHWMTDTLERVSIENVDSAADFVYELVKAL
jgi:hypothetical protein